MDLKQDNSVTSGTDDVTSGTTSGAPEGKGDGPEVVPYSTYKKVLSELTNNRNARKELESKLGEIHEKEKEAEKTRLEQQGEYKKLLDIERKKNEDFLKERDEYRENLVLAHKLNAFKEKLPGRLSSPEYYSFVDTSSIVIDPETNTIDDSSVDLAVNNFMTKHARLVDTAGGKLPHNAPQNTSTLSYDQWLKLPVKEKRQRLKDVINKE